MIEFLFFMISPFILQIISSGAMFSFSPSCFFFFFFFPLVCSCSPVFLIVKQSCIESPTLVVSSSVLFLVSLCFHLGFFFFAWICPSLFMSFLWLAFWTLVYIISAMIIIQICKNVSANIFIFSSVPTFLLLIGLSTGRVPISSVNYWH